MTSKQAKYDHLVALRKSCNACKGLINPTRIENGLFDSDRIGPWTGWQGNIYSKLMLIAQDWGHVGNFIKYKGKDTNSETNKTLKKLFKISGLELSLPLDSDNKELYFFTNAIVCLKDGSDQAPVDSKWYENCGPYLLRPLIEIINPRVVICLGQKAYDTILNSYDRHPYSFRQSVDRHSPIIVNSGVAIFPVYHCGRRIRNTHRNELQQENDWKQIGTWLKGNNIFYAD